MRIAAVQVPSEIPDLFAETDLAARQAVMIDVLRASSTITHALQSGSAAIIPCLRVEDAIELGARLVTALSPAILKGGERGGLRIPGFDLANSPSEYTPARVAGRSIIFTTTNGTRALHAVRSAARVLVGCINNISALCRDLANDGRDVLLVCAGTNNAPSAEDIFTAAAIASSLHANGATLEPSARDCIKLWHAHNAEGDLLAAFEASPGGRNLIALGLNADIVWCAQRDSHAAVGEWFKDGSSLCELGEIRRITVRA
jgi:2-phosphosulfolactate phosphatase